MSAVDAFGALALWPQWIPVRLVPLPNGKTDKLPIDYRTCRVTEKGSDGAHNPMIWTPLVAALRLAEAIGPNHTAGFVITDRDDVFCVDIDDALQPDGTWSPLAHEIVAELPGCMVEISQSGRGLHIWGRYPNPPKHRKRRIDLHIECYTERRFIAIGSSHTGQIAERCDAFPAFVAKRFADDSAAAAGMPLPAEGPRADYRGPADDEVLLPRMLRSHSKAAMFGGGKASFAALWDADAAILATCYPSATGDVFDRSSADAALFAHLAYWCGCDAQRMEHLARRSKLYRAKWDDRDDYLPRTIAGACQRQRDVLQDPLPPAASSTLAAPVNTSLSFLRAANGQIPARLENVVDTLASPESGVRIVRDAFLDRVLIASADKPPVPLTDVHLGILRAEFGRRGFGPIGPEIMRTAVHMVAEGNRFDSAVDWVNSQTWDGTPRIELALPRYFGAADTPYSRAAGRYLFTALAGRALVPGCRVDMVLTLYGGQGKRKTSGVEALSPDPEFFVEMHFGRIDHDDAARLLRGKLVVELAELGGRSSRDRELIKAWITKRAEQWTPKYVEHPVRYDRRNVFIGTTNEPEFLDDPTGERRWLPVRVGDVDVESIERDRDQLWAEGAAVFRASGVAWQDAQRLARDEHAAFKVVDAWSDPIESWLSRPSVPAYGAQPGGPPNGSIPFTLVAIAAGALGIAAGSVDKRTQNRIAAILRGLGYDSGPERVDGSVRWRWRKA